MGGRGDGFGKEFWEGHWEERGATRAGGSRRPPAHPALAEAVDALAPGRALDAGCGTGAEARWLASRGWEVTAVDISAHALADAARDAEGEGRPAVRWVEADLTTWHPEATYDLVTTFYAHAPVPQLDLYSRLASWVAPGGTLLLVGHGTGHAGHHQGTHGGPHGGPPRGVTVTAEAVRALLQAPGWEVLTAEERRRPVVRAGGSADLLDDVVVRAQRH